MIDFIKCIDLRLPTQSLLNSERLLFPLSVDEQTGAIIDGPRRAQDQGLAFTLIPSTLRPLLRCELKGSLHRYHNGGTHNANQYTVTELTATLRRLAQTYQIDLTQSFLNNMEFGVNVALPFPVSRVLDNLISYKNRPFSRETGDGFAYYQCATQRYVVKIYDKGTQYRDEVPDLPDNLLRVEIKVLKMEYLTRQGVNLRSLADLLQAEHYPKLGRLLVETFSEILFDEPTVDRSRLKPRQLERYLDGRNAKYWLLDDTLPASRYNAQRQKLHRDLIAFRQLLRQYRVGDDWQAMVADLIAHAWQRLTNPDEVFQPENRYKLTDLGGVTSENRYKLTGILGDAPENRYKLTDSCQTNLLVCETVADEETNRNELTGNDSGTGAVETLQINRLNIELICNISPSANKPVSSVRGTPTNEEESTSPASANQAEAAAVFSSSSQPVRSIETRQPTPAPIPTGNATLPAAKPDRARPLRRQCPISGVEVTHQAAPSITATHATLQQLPADLFDALAERFLTPEQNQLNSYGRIAKLTAAIRREYQTQSGETAQPVGRQCPITGIDIADQPATSPTVTPATLRGLPETRIDELTRQYLVPYDYHRTFSTEQRIEKLVLVIRKLYRAQHQEPVEVAPKPVRYCPVTGLDITHQLPTCLTATEGTLTRLDADQLDALAERYLLPGHNRLGSHARIAKLALVIRQAGQGLAVAVSTTPTRYCAMTGVDITHQRSDTLLAGRKTLQRLIGSDPDRIDELSAEFLTPAQQRAPITHRCFGLAQVIRQRYEQLHGTITRKVP